MLHTRRSRGRATTSTNKRRLRHNRRHGRTRRRTTSTNDQRRLQRQIPARIAHIHLIRTRLQQPLLRHHIPHTQILARQRKRDLRTRAGRQQDLFEAAQLARRAAGDADVELGDFGGGDGAGVAESDGDGEEGAEEVGVAAGDDGGGGGVGC